MFPKVALFFYSGRATTAFTSGATYPSVMDVLIMHVRMGTVVFADFFTSHLRRGFNLQLLKGDGIKTFYSFPFSRWSNN